MKLELKPSIIDDGSRTLHNGDHAGCSKDGVYSWIYKDSVLELSYSQTNESLAQWRFGKVLNDRNTTISFVTDFKCSDGHMLLVATENLSDEGTLCFFSISKKRVVRAVEFPKKIRAVEVLFTNTREEVPPWILSKHLQFFYGLAAVGTEGGYLFLLDLCLDDVIINTTSEIQPKKLSVSSPNFIDPKAKRDSACTAGRHMAVLLDEQCHRNGKFYHRRQDDSIDKVFDEETVCVTTLKYLHQAGSLAVGFSFGCFQLWRLYSPVLDYSTRYHPNLKAISKFVVQEPENDPRNLVYLWSCQDNSVLGEDESHGDISSISLYQLCFNKKDLYPGFGLFYEDLESVCGRLDHNLLVNPYVGVSNPTMWSSQLVCAYTVVNPLYTPPHFAANDSFEESSHGNDLSLSIFVWRADSKQSGQTSCYWMAIFDLNRWYHAQMPHAIRVTASSPQVCAYWAVYKLDEIITLSYPQSLLHVQVTGNNVLKFINKSPLPPEEHSFPSALEITDVRFITPQRTITCHCYGWQGQLLHELVQDGALHLVQPSNFYHQCLQARLIPQNYNENKANSIEHQRKVLLNLSLDHNLTVRLIHHCIDLWADGEFVESGCSLTLLLEWAWAAVFRIKEKLDTACQVLHDCSGHTLDSYTDWVVRRQHCSMISLKQVFTIFLSQTNPTTERGQQELEMRLEVIRLLVKYHNMVRWCLNETLLPELTEDNTQVPGLFVYPYREMSRAMKKRRAELKALKGVVTDHSLLLIDGLMKSVGPQITTIWEAEDEDSLYPPPSMQALLGLFLQEDIMLEVKQAIFLYFLQDLATLMDCNDMHQTVVVSFVRSFNLLPCLVHAVQGLWFIDHRDYEEGLRQLVNPNVVPQSWSSWLDVAVVNTLLAQGQNATAAHYIHSGHCLGATLDEQRLNIAVLVRNCKVSPAVDYMRQRYQKHDPAELMPFMMIECQAHKMIGQLLQLQLLLAEEEEVEKYLRGRSEPQALEPLLLYYLTHSRFVEAFTLNEEMNKMDKLEATCHAAREKAANRNRLMEAYLKVLPDITRKLLVEKQRRPSLMTAKKIEVTKPKPLSMVVYKKDQNAMSRSHMIMAVMDKVEEAMKVVEEADNFDWFEKNVELEENNNSVFAATPLTPRHKSFISHTHNPIAVSYPESLHCALPANPLSAAKRELQGNNLLYEESDRQSLSVLTKECLDLLRTPLKGTKTETSPRAIITSVVKTPQSILKVRRLSKSLLSSHMDSSTYKTPSERTKGPHKLKFSASDSVISSPTSPSQDKPETKMSPRLESLSTTTPKQLRFFGVSPSPSPSPLPVGRLESPADMEAKSSSFVSEESSPEISIQTAEDTDEDHERDTEKEMLVESASRQETVIESVPIDSNDREEQEMEENDVEDKVTNTAQEKDLETNEQSSSFAGGSSDRYDDEISDLVRPDLQSPWKQDQSSEEAVTMDENVSLNVSHIEGESITPTMTSSPLEEIPLTTTDDKLADSAPVLPVGEKAIEENAHHEESEKSEITKLHRNILMSLMEPRKSIVNLTLSETMKESVTHSSHVSVSERLKVDTSTISLSSVKKTRGDLSPEKRLSLEPDSPPATPPLSKRAKMIVRDREATRDVRRSEFNFATPNRELRSRRTERSSPAGDVKSSAENESESVLEAEIKPRERKTPERRSPARAVKRKTTEDSHVEKEDEDLELNEKVVRKLRKTPERKSPGRSAKRKANDDLDDEKDHHLGEEKEDESENLMSRLRKTPERKSPGRTAKRKAVGDVDGEKDKDGDEKEDKTENLTTRSRKTPERKSPARSVKRKVAVAADEDENKDKSSLESSETVISKDHTTPENLPLRSNVESRQTRLSPSRSAKKKEDSSEVEKESSPVIEIARRNLRQRKTPERKSPARTVKKTTVDEKDDANREEEVIVESGIPSRLRSSPARAARSKTPERKSTSRKPKVSAESVVEENMTRIAETNSEIKTGEEDEHFTPAEEFVQRLAVEEEVPLSPSRRRSTRLNTPDRALKPSQPLESERRQSRSRQVSASSASAEENLKTLKKSAKKAPSPARILFEHSTEQAEEGIEESQRDTTEDGHSVRRSRRLSRTPERFRSAVESNISKEILKSRIQEEENITSQAERSTKNATSEENSHSLSIESTRLSHSHKSDVSDVGVEPLVDTTVEKPDGLVSSQAASDFVFSKPLEHTDDVAQPLQSQTAKTQMNFVFSPPSVAKRELDNEKPHVEKKPNSRKGMTRKRDFSDDGKSSDDTTAKESDGTADEVWSEDLPPLRLEDEESKKNHGDGTTDIKTFDKKLQNESESQVKTAVYFKDYSSTHNLRTASTSSNKGVSSSFPSPSFVFSDPLAHSADCAQPGEPCGQEVETDQGFVFSQPTVAEQGSDEDTTQTKKKAKKEEKSVARKSKRVRKNLLDSPALLPLTSPEFHHAQMKKDRSRSRMSDIQRASVSVVKRYSKRSGPVTRRLIPSSQSSDHSGTEK